MIFSAFIASISQILLKKSANKEYKSFINEYINPLVITGYFLLTSSMLLNIVAYRGVNYKLGPVLNATSYVFVLVLGHIILCEKITCKKIAGMILIIIGIIVFNI